jgi:hypothetical protein
MQSIIQQTGQDSVGMTKPSAKVWTQTSSTTAYMSVAQPNWLVQQKLSVSVRIVQSSNNALLTQSVEMIVTQSKVALHPKSVVLSQ